MKFGRKWEHLRHAPWQDRYVDYKLLKRMMKSEGAEGHFNFKYHLQGELKKCNGFFVATVCSADDFI